MDASPLPAGGYLRMPIAWLALPISPQAKTLLMAFCAYADNEGASYYSYEQLGAMLQRSKSSVCSYVQELREHGLITCTRQTYGNGYNYRLLIQINRWAEILAGWEQLSFESRARKAAGQARVARGGAGVGSGTVRPPSASARAQARWNQPSVSGDPPVDQSAERRVQSAECKDPKGPINQIHQTQTPPAAPRVEWSDNDEAEWRAFRPSDRDPPFQTHGTPSPALLRKVIDAARALEAEAGLLSGEEAKKQAREAISCFVAHRRLKATAEEQEKAAEALVGTGTSSAALLAAIKTLEEAWKPHWKRLSTPTQIQEATLVANEAVMPSKIEMERLGRFRNRAWIASNWLAKHPPSPRLVP